MNFAINAFTEAVGTKHLLVNIHICRFPSTFEAHFSSHRQMVSLAALPETCFEVGTDSGKVRRELPMSCCQWLCCKSLTLIVQKKSSGAKVEFRTILVKDLKYLTNSSDSTCLQAHTLPIRKKNTETNRLALHLLVFIFPGCATT